MKGLAFRVWREAEGLTQGEAAKRAEVSPRTVIRAEAAAESEVPFKLAIIAAPPMLDDLPPPPAELAARKAAPKVAKAAAKAQAAAKVADKVQAPVKASPALLAAMRRNPPFAKTAAEAKAMRQLRADQKGVALANIRLLPLQPDWRRLESGRQVNAAIPEPLDQPAPDWAGDRGVLTASGAVYDYEAAHRMHPPRQLNAANVTAGEW